MKNYKNKKILQVVLITVIAVITLGIGYAAISEINLIINGNATANVNQNNFKVYFTTANITTGTGTASIDSNDNTIAYFDITGLSKVGDTAVATYTVLNNSNSVGADISLNVTSSNTEYFKVTEHINDTQLQAGDYTTATVTVEMIKTPIENNVSTSVSAKLIANPIENASATGSGSASAEAIPDPVSFSTDSWATIKKAVHNNNVSLYHVGDTKTVTIGANNYTVRIANKTTGEHCGDEDTAYSQTACGFVVEFSDIITTMQMRNTGTNVGGYPATLVYDYLNNTLLGELPNDLQSVIEPTRVISGHGSEDSTNFTTTDNLYLLSGVEVFGSDGYDTAASTTTQLEYYQNSSNSKIKQYNSSNQWWWLRPAASDICTGFRCVPSSGRLGSYRVDATGGVSPAFRIA